jgi:hypothetical protein
MKTFKQAIKSKKNDNVQQTAQLSEMIAIKHCLRPESIYNWAIRFDVKLIDYMPIIMSTGDELLNANSALLGDILNDKFDEVKQLKK